MNLANHYPTFLSSETGSDYFRIKGLWRYKLFILFFFNRGVLLIWRSSITPVSCSALIQSGAVEKDMILLFFKSLILAGHDETLFNLSQKKSLHKGEQLLFILAKNIDWREKSYFDLQILFYQSETLFVYIYTWKKCLSLQIITYFFIIIHNFTIKMLGFFPYVSSLVYIKIQKYFPRAETLCYTG